MARSEHPIRSLSILLALLVPGLFCQAAPASPSTLLIRTGTPVELQLAQTISSAGAHKSERLEFVVVKDVVIGGFTVIQTGTQATGSVIHVRGKRPLGIGGAVTVRLDSVDLASGQPIALVARKEFKGRSRTFRMGMKLAIAGAIYWPVAPVLLLSRGRDSTALKGSEVTAYTRNDVLVQTANLPKSQEELSELSEMINLLPPRALNAEGREGDMLNLIFLAREDDLQKAFAQAGWLKADTSIPRIIWRLMWRRTHYKQLPMDQLYVYGRPQDYSYVLPDPRLIVARRHHVRIWKTDREVNGIPLWVGAATHDVSIELVKHKFRLYHRIDPNVDAERDFIARNLAATGQLSRQEYKHSAVPVLSAKTATGQNYHSDGRMLFLDLNQRENPMAGAADIAGLAPAAPEPASSLPPNLP